MKTLLRGLWQVLRAPLLVLGLALAIVAVKIGLLVALARTFRVKGVDAMVFALYLSQVGEFAFVLFGAAGTQNILPRATIDILNAATAASMLTTPFLIFAFERWIAPRLTREAARPDDVIDEQNPVIVAGYGRFGQVVARLLLSRNVGVTVIDHDSNQVELVRRFGSKAYYGDATRLDLLESAGAARATLLVVAVDDPQSARFIVAQVRDRFPKLKVIARARSRTEAYDFHAQGVISMRETFGSALEVGEAALQAVGFDAEVARKATAQFRHHDEAQLAAASVHRNDIKKLIAFSRQGTEDLKALMEKEAAEKEAGQHLRTRS